MGLKRTLISCKKCNYKCQMPYQGKVHIKCPKCGGETRQRVADNVEKGWDVKTEYE